jgi:hypothetical protein
VERNEVAGKRHYMLEGFKESLADVELETTREFHSRDRRSANALCQALILRDVPYIQ